MNELNSKEIVHRAGEDERIETRKLTRSEMKKIVEIEATSMSEEDKKKIKDFNETMYVVVLNYTTASVKFYKLNKVEDVETWLKDHTDYNEPNCYYMTSPKPFEIKIDDVAN